MTIMFVLMMNESGQVVISQVIEYSGLETLHDSFLFKSSLTCNLVYTQNVSLFCYLCALQLCKEVYRRAFTS